MSTDNILDIVFPKFCLGCGYLGRYICPTCEKKLKREKKQECCIYCKKRSYLGLTHPRCKRKKGVDGHNSLYLYRGLFKKIIHSVKYGGAYKVLGELLLFQAGDSMSVLFRWRSFLKLNCQVVPLHIERQNERGFNQASYILLSISVFLHANIINVLKKIKKTRSQATLSTEIERLKNIRGSFTCLAHHLPESVLLVDDVVTTGSTVKECAHVLKENGVKNVFVFSLARG